MDVNILFLFLSKKLAKGRDFIGMAESVIYCSKRLAGKEQSLTNAQFYKKFIEGRTFMTKATYYSIQLRTQYLLGEHESAHEMVFFFQVENSQL